MTLLDSLLDAIVRLDGEALIMHVGEKPYVVLSSITRVSRENARKVRGQIMKKVRIQDLTLRRSFLTTAAGAPPRYLAARDRIMTIALDCTVLSCRMNARAVRDRSDVPRLESRHSQMKTITAEPVSRVRSPHVRARVRRDPAMLTR